MIDSAAHMQAVRGTLLAFAVWACCLVMPSGTAIAGESVSVPQLPLQFRAKIRLWLVQQEHPSLVLYHHDAMNQRSREDYYSLVEGRHQRFYSSIRHVDKAISLSLLSLYLSSVSFSLAPLFLPLSVPFFAYARRVDCRVYAWYMQGISYMIFHKQERSPRACFIVPNSGFPVSFEAMQDAVFLGRSSIMKKGQPLTCNHFRTRFMGARVEFCVDPGSGVPLVFESPLFRVDVLHFEAMPQSAELFDPRRASHARCGVIGSPPLSDDDPLLSTSTSGRELEYSHSASASASPHSDGFPPSAASRPF